MHYWRALEIRSIKNFWKTKYYQDWKNTSTHEENHSLTHLISAVNLSDRFYDDNVWLGIDFTDSYRMTGKQAYLEKAKLIWKFILSGKDDVLGGGIYWCEQKKESKNTCSNAPGAVFALKLFQATQDDAYLKQGKDLYEWTKEPGRSKGSSIL